MALDYATIRKVVERPKKKEILNRIVRLQDRIRFHTEVNTSVRDVTRPAGLYLDWVSELIPKDKFAIFSQLFRFPLPSSDVVDEIYRELERVFYSRNSSMTYQFSSSELQDDWRRYRRERLDEPNVWKTDGWRNMRIAPNSILVVDLPVEQTTERPEPYFYWLGVESVIDYRLDGDHTSMKWIVFRQGDDRIAVMDEESTRVYGVGDDRNVSVLITEAKHGLGYCPARFFWTTRVNELTPDIKRNPITGKLSRLDWYLFFDLSKEHLDLYAPYPIYSAYAADCNYENNETGDYCDGGFLRGADGEYRVLSNGSLMKCPVCGDKRIAGPGSFIEVPIPNQSEGVVDMRNPVQITSIDKDSLDYNVNEVKRLRDDIILSVIGHGDAVSQKEAVNEAQMAANFEGKTGVLNALKRDFELAQKFVEDTVCRLRYGDDFVGSSISWGTEFYVFTTEELYAKYSNAKKMGAPVGELDSIMNQILEVEYKNDPLMYRRMMTLKALEPYRHMTMDQVLNYRNNGMMDEVLVQMKLNFSNYIDRFERENTNIVDFGSSLKFDKKIDIITKKLKQYAKESRESWASGGAGASVGDGTSAEGAREDGGKAEVGEED